MKRTQQSRNAPGMHPQTKTKYENKRRQGYSEQVSRRTTGWKGDVQAEFQQAMASERAKGSMPSIVGIAKKAYDVLPVPETKAQSRYHNQLQKYQAFKAGQIKGPIAKPRRP